MERLTTERLEFFTLGLADRERAYEEGRVGAQGGLVSFITEENAMARELLALRAQVVAQDVQEIPSPPLGRELGRSPIPTPRRQEREALLSIVRGSCEVDTVRKAALALLGEVQR